MTQHLTSTCPRAPTHCTTRLLPMKHISLLCAFFFFSFAFCLRFCWSSFPWHSSSETDGSALVFQLCISCLVATNQLCSYLFTLLRRSGRTRFLFQILVLFSFSPSCPFSDMLNKDAFYLNSHYHAATIERFHNVLRANIQVLGQVNLHSSSAFTQWLAKLCKSEVSCLINQAVSEICVPCPGV